MIILKKISDLRNYLSQQRQLSRKIGFVPTMGALHQGHLSLIRTAEETDDIVVCSIFVNPTQFNDKNDFTHYPVSTSRDISLLEAMDCDVLFLPAAEEIYPEGTALSEPYEIGYLEALLEGNYRPGHFQGVCQVVHRLLDIVQPDDLFMGQKDLQQVKIIQKLIADKQIPVQLHIVPILRHETGLAYSSRNARLSETDKEKAVVLSRSLMRIRKALQPGDLSALEKEATELIQAAGFEKVDYVSIVNAETLRPVSHWDGKEPLAALIAAWLNNIRLIDNEILN